MTEHRVNRDKGADLYKPRQAGEHFIPYIDFTPEWFIDCGPGSAVEFIAARKAWPNVSLLGLEPSPVGYKSAKDRWPGDGILLPVAVWDSDTTVRLYYPQDLLHGTAFSDGDRNIRDDVSPTDIRDFLDVPARSLDSLDKEYGPFSKAVLWMDIEGAERRALRGAKELLQRRAIWAVNIEVRPDSYWEVFNVLCDAGLKKVREYFACETVRDEVWVIR